ncbi:Serine/threonine-protein phosphatase 7 long form-like protein [Hordeum vulgare]|nr:Serine/threonine-protein phosphatase 7 long form-like protein [Hordeum vulgare]
MAEQEAWKLADQRKLDLVVINPSLALAPLLQTAVYASIWHIAKYLDGSVHTETTNANIIVCPDDVDKRLTTAGSDGKVCYPMVTRLALGYTKGTQMAYDVCYEPFFERAGFLPFVLQFKRVPLVMNHVALTTLLDRWRPETDNFHLPCGDMTLMLEDFAMITGFPIEGKALTGCVDNKNWHERVTALINGCSTSRSLQGRTDNRINGVPFPWLETHRSGCPVDANTEIV